MTHKRFDHPNGALKDMNGYSGINLPDGVSPEDAAEDLYSRVGERFPVKWEPWATAEPVVDTNNLPQGVTEMDVENALNNMKANGML